MVYIKLAIQFRTHVLMRHYYAFPRIFIHVSVSHTSHDVEPTHMILVQACTKENGEGDTCTE
jgi:hypothetical protein